MLTIVVFVFLYIYANLYMILKKNIDSDIYDNPKVYKIKTGRGKKILVLSCIHGDEQSPSFYFHRMIQCRFSSIRRENGEIGLPPATYYFIPCVNKYGFKNHYKYDSYGNDLDCEWDSDSNSTIVFLKKYIDKCDYIINFYETSGNSRVFCRGDRWSNLLTETKLQTQKSPISVSPISVSPIQDDKSSSLIRGYTLKDYCTDKSKNYFAVYVKGIDYKRTTDHIILDVEKYFKTITEAIVYS